ncbi:MAG: response regulator, partial [Methanobacterium sp.]
MSYKTMPKILIVEDEAITAMDLESILQKLGYEVVSIASTGEEAIQKSEELEPDLVLMDIVLKGQMDGISATKEIQSCYDIPVIYLTAYSDKN